VQEPLRSQYLAALGIDNYVPRFILPAAKLSEQCVWIESNNESVDADSARVETLQNKSIAPSSVNQTIQSEKTQRTPVADTAIRRTEAIGANIAEKPAHTPIAGPQFALSIVLAAGGILLIDDAPVSSAERSGYQKFLSNMLPALRPAAAQYVLDIFLWPMTQQPKISRDAAAAKETLTAHLHKQIQQRAIDTVLLLGTTAQQWCVLAEANVRIVKSSSLLACVRDPALKRQLWNDIRHLSQP
jgi:hypothetical protein